MVRKYFSTCTHMGMQVIWGNGQCFIIIVVDECIITHNLIFDHDNVCASLSQRLVRERACVCVSVSVSVLECVGKNLTEIM